MQIRINNETIDFSLENERTLGEVFDGISSWLAKAGFIIMSCAVDGKSISDIGKGGWRTEGLESIGIIDLKAVLPADIRFRHFSVLEKYFYLLKNSVTGNDTAAMKDLSEDLPNVLETMKTVIGGSSDDAIIRNLVSVLTDSGLLETGEIRPGTAEALGKTLESVRMLFVSRMEEISAPVEMTVKTLAYLASIIPELNEVSVLLQTGRDREAMDSVIRFIEASQKLLRLLSGLHTSGIMDMESLLVDGKNLSTYYADFNTILSELLEAFEAKDSVLIGDLLEYEISPRLEKLTGIMKNLQESTP